MKTNKKQPMRQAFAGLPPYAGGKRRLVQAIFTKLSQSVPVETWSRLTFADLFLGGGAVSLFAKAQGFGHICCNDWAARGAVIGQGVIANAYTRLSEVDYLRLVQPCEETAPGFVEQTFGGSVFSQRHVRFLDGVARQSRCFESPIKRALGQLLLWHLVTEFVAFGTSIGTSNRPFAEVLDGKAGWWTLNPKRLRDNSLAHLLQSPTRVAEKKWERINRAIFAPAGTVTFHQQDALTLVSAIQADILYLDPPYPQTLAYEKANAVLDTILQGKQPETSLPVSPFTKGTQALSDLLSQSRHIPVWLVSYGNKAIEKEGLIDLIRQADPKRQVEGWAYNYQHFSHVAKTAQNQELLVLAVDTQTLNTRLR